MFIFNSGNKKWAKRPSLTPSITSAIQFRHCPNATAYAANSLKLRAFSGVSPQITASLRNIISPAVQRHYGRFGTNGTTQLRHCQRPAHHCPAKSRRNLYVSRTLKAAASEAMPPIYRHTRATECARLRAVTFCRRLVAKPRTPHLHCAARAVLQDRDCQCWGSRGTPLAFLWGIKRGYSLRKENTPFVSCSANRRCLPRPS